jgi:uncharacterized protein (DUF1800 family)
MSRIWPSAAQAVKHARRTARAPLHWDPYTHVLSRFTFGPTPSDRRYLAEHGIDAWYRSELRAARECPGYQGNAKVAAQGPLLTKTPAQTRAWLKAHGNEYDWNAMDQLTQVTLGLQAWSRAQLFETLVDFFSNHLNVSNHNGDVWTTRHGYDHDVIRRHALGTFTDMLLASARHPAMLLFLNLAESTKAAVNENYGRELLELHTVGLVYSESDVKNAARLLTGRTIDDDFNYRYDASNHPTGPIAVLGFRHDNARASDGESGGDALLRYLARHPATASHLARKLCVRFVSDAPSRALVSAVADAYLEHGTAILPMITTILHSQEFWESRGCKVRRPAENLIATVRALGTKVTDMGAALETLHWMSAQLGNAPLDWPAPNGYPDTAEDWRSSGTMLNLWELHLGFADSWWDGFAKSDARHLYGHAPRNSGEAVDALTRRLTGMRFTPTHRAALQDFLDEPARTPLSQSTLRWQAAPLAAIILDGPHHALR